MKHEARVSTAEQIELGAHQHRARNRRTKRSGSGFKHQREGVGRVVRTVSDLDRRSRFEEGREIESELLGLAGNDA